MAWWRTCRFAGTFAERFLLYLLSLPLWLLGGYIWGVWMWRAMEKRKQTFHESDDPPQ